MGFRTGAYAKVWKIKKDDKGYASAQISVSKKNKETDEYTTDFSGYVRLGRGVADKISEGDRIRIGDCDVTTFYQKDTGKTYTTFFLYSLMEEQQQKQQEQYSPECDDDDEPF